MAGRGRALGPTFPIPLPLGPFPGCGVAGPKGSVQLWDRASAAAAAPQAETAVMEGMRVERPSLQGWTSCRAPHFVSSPPTLREPFDANHNSTSNRQQEQEEGDNHHNEYMMRRQF